MAFQSQLFSQHDAGYDTAVKVDIPNADVRYCPDFLMPEEADQAFSIGKVQWQWQQEHIKMYGRRVKIPRLQAWYGEPGATYRYSGMTMTPLPWHPLLLALKERCEHYCLTQFNSVLANLYRNGDDSMGFHADDEPELGDAPVIASLSLGGERNFDFKARTGDAKKRLQLAHGSLLIMAGQTQTFWHHGINKTKKPVSPRINLTFRWINY